MRRVLLGMWAVVLLATAAFAGTVVANHGTDAHSENMERIANYGGDGDRDSDAYAPYRNGTDMAFWGDLAVLGNLDQGTGPNASPTGGFRLLDISNPAEPKLEGQFKCLGDQSDVSVWGDLVILSVDKPTKEFCTDDANARRGGAGDWEGIRILSIADRKNPEILETVATRCGSHTNTIVPDRAGNRLLVYALSYPLAGRYNPAQKMAPRAANGPGCNAADHGIFSVIEVPLDEPEKSRVIATPSVAPTVGCHDVTVFLERKVAAAACLTESQIWDISDPASPDVVAHVPNPAGLNLSHSTVFSNDGGTLVVGDELGGAAASPGCVSKDQRYVSGGLFFFDTRGIRMGAPKHVGTYKLPRDQASLFCTAHLFNVVPTHGRRDVLVSSWYSGATSVIDFTDPRRPREIAHAIPRAPTTPDRQASESATWASYWYRGHVYANNFDEDVNSVFPYSRGLDVFRVDHPAVAKAIRLPRLNPQVQEPLPPKEREPQRKQRR